MRIICSIWESWAIEIVFRYSYWIRPGVVRIDLPDALVDWDN